MRGGVELLREQEVLLFDGLVRIALAEAEARAGDVERAITTIDEALETVDRTGCRAFEAELHRIRGEMLLRRDNPAPAEEAFHTAIAVAKQQGTRSFGLRAAFSLAGLYQSTARPADAHAVLAPALEGFSPTPEMPEIAEAQALLATLSETDQVRSAISQRTRRLQLQTAYGQAMMYSRGFGAEETKAAFARAAELSTQSDSFSERFAAAHGRWTTGFMGCEFRTARELASAFLKEAEDAGRMVEAGVARRGLALISYFLGNFLEARTHCEKALDACDPQRDQEARERFTDDTGTLALSVLAGTSWQLGEIDRARELIDAATRRATELGHFPSIALPLLWRWNIEILRGDAAAALNACEAVVVLGREHGMSHWRARGEIGAAWARGRLYDPTAGAIELRRMLGAFADQGTSVGISTWEALLAELEAETLGPAIALGRLDDALARADHVEYRCELAFMYRIRGDILRKFDPANTSLAENAYRMAIAIASEQSARSPRLQAALSLAKLYQSTGRPADAHAVLTPALEGFAPTPEMPEIAEAQALLVAIEAGAHVRPE
jgi:tetratricopeptide (TPR) repeat protein